MLAEKLVTHGADFAEAWNFGPETSDVNSVSWIVNYLCQKIPNATWELDSSEQPHEANILKLDSSKAKSKLGWSPRLSLESALDKTVEWHQAWNDNQSMAEVSIRQINNYIDK